MGANADAVKNGWDAFAKGDMDAAGDDERLSRDRHPRDPAVGRPYTGPDGFKEMIGKFLSNFEEVNPAPQEFLEADGGRVVVKVSAWAEEERQRAQRRFDLAVHAR